MHFYPPKTTLSQPTRFRSKPRQHSSTPTYFATDYPHKNKTPGHVAPDSANQQFADLCIAFSDDSDAAGKVSAMINPNKISAALSSVLSSDFDPVRTSIQKFEVKLDVQR